MKLTKTFGGLTVSATPAPLPGVTFVLDGPPGEFLDMTQARELYELLGDVLGEARCHRGYSENDLLAHWQRLQEEGDVEGELSRDQAELLFIQALKHFDFDIDAADDLIHDALVEHALQNNVWTGDDDVVKVAEPSSTGES